MNKAGAMKRNKQAITANVTRLNAITKPSQPCDVDAGEWLYSQIRKSQHGAFMTEAELTPKLAKELLERNEGNRRASVGLIEELADTMAAGDFDGLNGETIKVSICGKLNDGQHRCHAVVKARITIKTRFVFGLERESRKTIDQGKQRRAGDYLAMDGIANGNKVSAVAILLHYWRSLGRIPRPGGARTGGIRPGPSRAAEIASANIDQIKRSMDLIPKNGYSILGGYALICFAHVLFSEIDEAAATDFINGLVKGNDLSSKSPILSCRQRMTATDRLKRSERFELIVRSWNAWRENRELEKLHLRGTTPKISK